MKHIILHDDCGEVLVALEHIAAVRKDTPLDNSPAVLVLGNRSGRIRVKETFGEVLVMIVEEAAKPTPVEDELRRIAWANERMGGE